MASKYCWTLPLKQGTSNENMKKKKNLGWDIWKYVLKCAKTQSWQNIEIVLPIIL